MNRAIAWARDCLDDERTCVIDLETTGINDLAEPVEVAVVDREGRKVLYTRTRALALITPEAQRVHGIKADDLRGAPFFWVVYPVLRSILQGARVIAYNAEFDRRILDQTCDNYELPRIEAAWDCAMLQYAEYAGVPGRRPGEFKWHKLGEALAREGISPGEGALHNALADALCTLALVREMAVGGER